MSPALFSAKVSTKPEAEHDKAQSGGRSSTSNTLLTKQIISLAHPVVVVLSGLFFKIEIIANFALGFP